MNVTFETAICAWDEKIPVLLIRLVNALLFCRTEEKLRLLEQQYSKAERWSVSDRSNYNLKVIRSLKGKLLEIKWKYTQPRQLSLF